MQQKITHQHGGTPPPHQKLTHPKNDVVFTSILQPYNHHQNPNRHRAISPPPFTLTSIFSATVSWLRNRRIRYIFLFLCSPFLLVFLFIAFPFLCVTELCLRRRLLRKVLRRFFGQDSGDRLRRCEEGCCDDDEEEEKGLLHRYLEDQLFLVRSMYDCGDDDDDDEDEEDSRRVEDSSSKIPLLLR